MKKLPLAMAGLGLIAGVVAPVGTVSALEANTAGIDAEFVITKINPKKNTLSFQYNGERPASEVKYLNIAYINTARVDETAADELAPMGTARPYWAKTVFYQYLADSDFLQDGVEITLNSGDMVSSLSGDSLGILYFSMRYTASTDFYSGKIDYSGCLAVSKTNAAVECRAEVKTGGGVRYQPYQNGVRMDVVIDGEEDVGGAGDDDGSGESGDIDAGDNEGGVGGENDETLGGADDGWAGTGDGAMDGDSDGFGGVDGVLDGNGVGSNASDGTIKIEVTDGSSVEVTGSVRLASNRSGTGAGVALASGAGVEIGNQDESVTEASEQVVLADALTQQGGELGSGEVAVPNLGTPNNNGWLRWWLVGLGVVGLGVGWWLFWLFWRRKRKEEEDADVDEVEAEEY